MSHRANGSTTDIEAMIRNLVLGVRNPKSPIVNVRWGARAGLLYAAFLSAFVLIAYLITGGQSIASVGLSLPVVLLFYAAAGLLGGVVLGLCRPLLRACCACLGMNDV